VLLVNRRSAWQSDDMTATPASTTATRPRTQAERRAATRTKLLQAAVESLTDRGYAATTAVEVQQRAGISRGALQHYWPSRAALVVDAVKALFDAMAAKLRADMADRAAGIADAVPAERIGLAIELLWSSFDSSLFRAELELWTAARYDPELRPLVIDHDRTLGAEIARLCRDMFGPDLAAHPRFAETIDVLTHGMRGAALIAELHPIHGPQLVREWRNHTCLALDVATDDD
jgi:AcrR family transcriptional regulator